MKKIEKQEWKAKERNFFGIDEKACIAERSDFLEKNEYGKRCIEDELLGRAILKHLGYYETVFNIVPTYVTDLNMQFSGVDSIINLGSRSITIDEKACYGGTTYNDHITLEIMQKDKYGRWHATQEGKITNEFIYINVCLDTNKLFVVRLSYPKMVLLADKYLKIMPEAIKSLYPGTSDGVYHMTGSGEGIYVLIPFNEAISVTEYDLTSLNNRR